MRTEPVRRDEVRVRGFQITAFPADACRPSEYGVFYVIPELFLPLLEELRRDCEHWVAEMPDELRQLYDHLEFDALDPARVLDVLLFPDQDVDRPGPRCRGCGREFFNNYCARTRGVFCSDACERQQRNRKKIAQVAARRAEARAGRVCAKCSKPLDANRSTRRYCSGRCRVAALRTRRPEAEPDADRVTQPLPG